MPNLVSLTHPSLQILGKSQTGVFQISRFCQSLLKENYHNSRTSDDIDMRLRPVTKPHKRNKTTSKMFNDDGMSENCDVILIFPIYGQFGAIRKPDFGLMKLSHNCFE